MCCKSWKDAIIIILHLTMFQVAGGETRVEVASTVLKKVKVAHTRLPSIGFLS